MLRVRPGDRVQVRERSDEGFALTRVRTPPGVVKAVKGSGMDARITVELPSGQVMAYRPAELELLPAEGA